LFGAIKKFSSQRAGLCALAVAGLLLLLPPASLPGLLPQPAYAGEGTGAFEGYTITKLASLDTVHRSLLGNNTADKPFIDSLDWHGTTEEDSFFVFRYCPDPQSCVIATASPDGRVIQTAFDPPNQYTSLSGAKVSPAGNALLFLAGQEGQSRQLFVWIKGSSALVPLTNGTQVQAYSWTNASRVAYAESEIEIVCEGGVEQCNNPRFNHDSKIWVARPTGEKVRTLYQDHSFIVDFALSPDEKKIAYTSFTGNPSDPGKEIRMSVFDSEVGSSKVMLSNRGDDTYYMPRWTPGGDAVLYAALTGDSMQGRSGEKVAPTGVLEIMNVASGNNAGRVALAGSSTGAVPFGFTVSRDGQYVFFAVNQDVSGDGIDGPGIYRMQLAHPVPEFPLAGLVAAVSIGAGVVAAARLRRLFT
jgi:hypothetical protein